MNGPIPEVFLEIGQLAYNRGARSIKDLPGCYEMDIDTRWWVAVNAHSEEMECSRGGKVPRYSMYLEFNGWPAGIINAGGGTLAAGACANEDELLAAIKAAQTAEPPAKESAQ